MGRRIHQHRRLLAALEAQGADPARLAHHADAAGLSRSAVEHATVAGRRAASSAPPRGGPPVPAGPGSCSPSPRQRSCLTNRSQALLVTRLRALRHGPHRRGLGGRGRAPVTSGSNRGRPRESATPGAACLACCGSRDATPMPRLRRFGRSRSSRASTPELAYAYSNMTQLHMLSSDAAATRTWGAHPGRARLPGGEPRAD